MSARQLKILHYMKREASGLCVATLELAKYAERQGHQVGVREPSADHNVWGNLTPEKCDIHSIHSQLPIGTYFDGKPKFMWMHGEPLSSVGNGSSMKAIIDLAPKVEAFLCMRSEEQIVWNAIKRTYYVPKGIDLEKFCPVDGPHERLSGSPAVLYYENQRGTRNALYVILAMQEVWKKNPKARLHIYNCTGKYQETFKSLYQHCKFWPFLRTLNGPVKDGVEGVNLLLNKVDIVVSSLYPLYARSIEAFGAGKAFIGPGYRENNYPYTCELQPESIADAITRCWDEYGKINFRQYAEKHHDVNETVKQAIDIYSRYL